jgi:hypothetical protein
MDQGDRVRRAGILCSHFLRNAAYYRVGWKDGTLRLRSLFWVTANGNFLDQCVLGWCKLFGDQSGEHYWQKMVADPTNFWPELLQQCGVSESQFDDYTAEMRLLRDKIIARADWDKTEYFPKLDLGTKSVIRLCDSLATSPETSKFMPETCASGAKFLGTCFYDAERVYQFQERADPANPERLSRTA